MKNWIVNGIRKVRNRISENARNLKNMVVGWIQELLKVAFVDQVESSIIELDPDKRYLLFLPEKLSDSLEVLKDSGTLQGLKLIIITTDSFRLIEF